MNHNASTVDYNISRFFIQTPTNENSASGFAACQRWWVCADGYRVVFTLESSNAGLCDAGPHGSTPADRLATRAVGVARGKAAQAGLRHRWQALAAAPAQVAVQLWTPGAKSPTRSKTGTLAQSHRYGARGRCTRPGFRMFSIAGI